MRAVLVAFLALALAMLVLAGGVEGSSVRAGDLRKRRKASLALRAAAHQKKTRAHGDELDEELDSSEDMDEGEAGEVDAATEDLDTQESEAESDPSIDEKLEMAGEKNWVVPNMKPLGFFKKAAGIEPNMTKYENTFPPTMIPRGGFALRSKKPETPKHEDLPQFKPPTVSHGQLQEIKAAEKQEEEAELRGTDVRDANELQESQARAACSFMGNTMDLARRIRAEEEAAKDGATNQGLVKLVNMVCPLLKFEYSYLMRCKDCAKMAARIAKLYDPSFDQKMFPGLQDPNRCDKDKWAIRNFAIEAALHSSNLFFGVDFCDEASETETDDEDAPESTAEDADADAQDEPSDADSDEATSTEQTGMEPVEEE